MFIKSYQLIFISTLMGGTLIAISSNTWFTAWLGLEINLMSILPLLLITPQRGLVEASIKYFLIQALASIMLIVSVAMNLSLSMALKMDAMEMLIFLAMIMKAGIPPLHFWFPNIMISLRWSQCFILFTWQKLAPLLLLTSLKLNKVMTIATISLITGVMGGLNQLLMKTLMTYSSIAHSSWVLIAATMSTSSCLFYFIIYCLMSALIISMVSKSPLKKMNELTSWNESATNKYTLIFNMLALAGLPPFLGFMVKLAVVILLIQNELNFMALLFVMMSLISLFYYFRILHSFFMKKQAQKFSPQEFQLSSSGGPIVACVSANVLIPTLNSMY